ncbi:MAG TPA: hypothetical protein VIO58_11720 [Candidatus Methanoperedens sp.]
MPAESLSESEIAEEINKAIETRETEYFSEIKEWLTKSGIEADKAKKELTKRIVEILSKYISNGLMQLTVDEMMKEKEFTEAFKKKKDHALIARLSKQLPPLKVYVEFVVKTGCIEIKKIRYDFKAEPQVEIKDAKIIIQENRITSVSFGSFIASITLYLLKGSLAVKLFSMERSLKLSEPSLPEIKEKSVNQNLYTQSLLSEKR